MYTMSYYKIILHILIHHFIFQLSYLFVYRSTLLCLDQFFLENIEKRLLDRRRKVYTQVSSYSTYSISYSKYIIITLRCSTTHYTLHIELSYYKIILHILIYHFIFQFSDLFVYRSTLLCLDQFFLENIEKRLLTSDDKL